MEALRLPQLCLVSYIGSVMNKKLMVSGKIHKAWTKKIGILIYYNGLILNQHIYKFLVLFCTCSQKHND